jgi:aspartate/tyrosine/aromatic aminotransferase
MSFFNILPDITEDEIFTMQNSFQEDLRPNKVNLGIGVYRTADNQSLVMTAVRKAESLISQHYPNKDYSPIDGSYEFNLRSSKLILGEKLSSSKSFHYFTAQTVGGTNGLRVAGDILRRLGCQSIFLSQPSWPNHKPIFEEAGLNIGSFPYFNIKTGLIDFEGISAAIKHMPPNSAILLQASCHNPSGADPSPEQWKELSALIKKQQLIPIFDIAYHGFGKGLDEDIEPLRLFLREGHELIASYSFAKNFGIYGERIGLMLAATSKEENVPKIGNHIKNLIRTSYSNPPIHGARIISILLKSPELLEEWKRELTNMRERISETRKALIASLYVERSNQDFAYLENHFGLFSVLCFTPNQVQWLRQEKAVYILSSGRINIAGLNSQNIPYVAHAIASATRIT